MDPTFMESTRLKRASTRAPEKNHNNDSHMERFAEFGVLGSFPCRSSYVSGKVALVSHHTCSRIIRKTKAERSSLRRLECFTNHGMLVRYFHMVSHWGAGLSDMTRTTKSTVDSTPTKGWWISFQKKMVKWIYSPTFLQVQIPMFTSWPLLSAFFGKKIHVSMFDSVIKLHILGFVKNHGWTWRPGKNK